MHIRNTTERWGVVAQALHWLIVALVLLQYVLATWADRLPLGLAKLVVIARHKSVGITILAIVLIRLVWRWLNPTPLLPDNLKPYERRLARLTHGALYVLLIAMPLTGWIASSARNFPVSWFNLVQLPDLVGPNQSLYETLMTVHWAMGWALAAIAALHVLGALKHHYVLKDDVLRRMLPFTKAS